MNDQATQLIARYTTARLASYTRKLGDVQQAQYATKFAIDDVLRVYGANTRNISEAYALEVLAMEVEDIETAAQ